MPDEYQGARNAPIPVEVIELIGKKLVGKARWSKKYNAPKAEKARGVVARRDALMKQHEFSQREASRRIIAQDHPGLRQELARVRAGGGKPCARNRCQGRTALTIPDRWPNPHALLNVQERLMSLEHSPARARRLGFGRLPRAVEESGLSRCALYKFATKHQGLFKKYGTRRSSTSTS